MTGWSHRPVDRDSALSRRRQHRIGHVGVRLDLCGFDGANYSRMARRARIHYPGAVCHVMPRRNGGQDVAFDEPERIRFCDLLEEGVKRSIVGANVQKRIRV